MVYEYGNIRNAFTKGGAGVSFFFGGGGGGGGEREVGYFPPEQVY